MTSKICLVTYATSKSIPIPPTFGKNSTAVTFDPSLAQTDPSSSPMTPAPIRRSREGTLSSDRAPVDDIMVFSSIYSKEENSVVIADSLSLQV